MILYQYHRKIQGNVCMDWHLTNDLLTSLQTQDGPKTVNSQAFKQFLNPQYAGTEAGSCQSLGYESKQLKFAAYVKPVKDAKASTQAFL
eukprot:CAMPEP_0196718040 /NCGR_PEP_ID=MMETSP1091-20130531/1332_1 /TAXON_ID=302021 /ORGANISM="Rhodomonas sp., Strain CCMP768" /LENGTH=88 /DNA_ID=CAMNT_0042058603 /DNA_START=214 /DNA_END=480 /DNA_ORIENTATION=-